jgi:hypothetical protein
MLSDDFVRSTLSPPRQTTELDRAGTSNPQIMQKQIGALSRTGWQYPQMGCP